ncbi:MAG: hypothetical protein DRI99_05915 [Candidatus Aminicenantes bacterium]|nr:MAG: hypothetical protein DRI99_05915 [Candidatus Aminicenantes bacterium]
MKSASRTVLFTLFCLTFSFIFSSACRLQPKEFQLVEDLQIGVDQRDENLIFGSVAAVSLDNEANIYLLDWPNYRIQIFTQDGHFLKSFPIKKGQGPTEIAALSGVAVHPDGKITLLDRGASKIVSLDKNGQILGHFKLDFSPTGIGALDENRIAILGLKEEKLVHLYDLQGHHLESFGEPFAPPSRVTAYKDVPLIKQPLHFDCSASGKIFLANPYAYEIQVYENGQLQQTLKGQSKLFFPLKVQTRTAGDRRQLSLFWCTINVVEHQGRLYAGLRSFSTKKKNHLEIFEKGKSVAILEVEGVLRAIDDQGRLYFSEEIPYPVMKRYRVETK